MRMRKRGLPVLFLIYLDFGLYFINSAIGYFSLPESISIIDKWVTLIGGALLILGGFNSFRISRHNV